MIVRARNPIVTIPTWHQEGSIKPLSTKTRPEKKSKGCLQLTKCKKLRVWVDIWSLTHHDSIRLHGARWRRGSAGTPSSCRLWLCLVQQYSRPLHEGHKMLIFWHMKLGLVTSIREINTKMGGAFPPYSYLYFYLSPLLFSWESRIQQAPGK